MRSVHLLCAALLALLSCLPSSVVAQAPTLLFHDPNTVVTARKYPTCAVNNHAVSTNSATPAMMVMGGYDANSVVLASYDWTSTGQWDFGVTQAAKPTFNWAYTNYTGATCNPIGRVAGGAAYLANGNVVVTGGKSCPSNLLMNDVIWSADGGLSYNLAIQVAPFAARADFAFVAAPTFNTIVLMGGSSSAATLNDVWMSSDGKGQVWTLVTNAASWVPFNEAAASFLFDSADNGGIPTLVLYHPTPNAVYTSVNWGASWTAVFPMANIGLDPYQDARMVAGSDNSLYLAGGSLAIVNQVLYSANKGQSWVLLNNSNYSPNISNTVSLTAWTYGCLAIRYVPSTTAPSGFHDQLVMYSGTLTVDNLIWSGYGCLFDAGSVAVTSLVAEVIQPNEVYSLGVSVPPSQLAPQLIHHDAGKWLYSRAYPDCGYDVHQAARKGNGVTMWHMGGFVPSSSTYINSIDVTTTGSWLNLQQFTPTYSGYSGTAPSGRVAGGVAYLANGNLLYFAGKDASSSIQFTNDVYLSADLGRTFTYVANASFQIRADFATAVLPLTNTVVLLGGQYSATGTSTGTLTNDVWVSSDGRGATWTRITAAAPFPPFQDAAFTALYDSSVISSSYTQAYSTLILYTGGYESIFFSSDLATTWTTLAAPWAVRTRGFFLADFDNFVYFTGGAEDGAVWFSWNKGQSWTNLNTAGYFNNPNFPSNGFRASSYYQNLYQYLGVTGTSGSCAALRYTANPQSPNGYHKTIVLYGGPSVYAVASLPSPSCVLQQGANVIYTEVMFPSERNNSKWTDTAMAQPPANTVPSAAFNSPTVLMSFRVYPTCAYDVHSLPNHPSAPATFVLGGWDQNNNVLATYDIVRGSQFTTYTYARSGGQNQQVPKGRTAGGAALLANGNLVWFGGKTNTDGATNVMANDVWVEQNPQNQNARWSMSSAAAPWVARSDMSTVAMPQTNCLVMIGGQNLAGTSLNDVWSSCDGTGASWVAQTTAAPWTPSNQAAMTALYDGMANGGSQANATILYYPTSAQQLFSSTNGGVSWTALGVVPFSYRTASRFVADAENNVYLIGGQSGTTVAADASTALQTQSINDVWYSSDKGNTWWQMPTVTNSAYSNPVQPSSIVYACPFINYAAGSGANGYHRQLTIVGGYQQVYSTAVQLPGQTTFSNTLFSFSSCICDEITGVRAMVADLIWPGETIALPAPSSSTSSSSSKTFSQGQTAGIAVGVGIGCILLTSLLWFFCGALCLECMSGNGSSHKEKRFEDVPEHSTTSQVEMPTTGPEGTATS